MKSSPESTVTVLVFIARKPGTSLAEFKEYYETKHIPYVTGLFMDSTNTPISYTRKYIDRGDEDSNKNTDAGAGDSNDYGNTGNNKGATKSFPFGGGHTFAYDVVTQLVFRDIAHRDACLASFGPYTDQIAADEANFLDRSTMRIVLVDEGWESDTGSTTVTRSE